MKIVGWVLVIAGVLFLRDSGDPSLWGWPQLSLLLIGVGSIVGGWRLIRNKPWITRPRNANPGRPDI